MKAITCQCCELVSINGIACHEFGCPNRGGTWDRERGDWVHYVDCLECGYPVEIGERCSCMDDGEGGEDWRDWLACDDGEDCDD